MLPNYDLGDSFWIGKGTSNYELDLSDIRALDDTDIWALGDAFYPGKMHNKKSIFQLQFNNLNPNPNINPLGQEIHYLIHNKSQQMHHNR